MTSPLPIIVDSEDRGMKRPVEEVARAIRWAMCGYASGAGPGRCDVNDGTIEECVCVGEGRACAPAVLDRLVQLGFLNDNYFVAKKAEEAADAGRGT